MTDILDVQKKDLTDTMKSEKIKGTESGNPIFLNAINAENAKNAITNIIFH